MSGLSDYLELALLNYTRGVAMPTAPTTIYVGLFSSDPTDAATGGTEVTTTLRTAGRVAVTFGTPVVGEPSTMSNSAIIDFGSAAAAASVSNFAVFDAATGGNKMFSGSVTTTTAYTAGQGVSFPVGSLVANLS